jgi:hypothetical protein
MALQRTSSKKKGSKVSLYNILKNLSSIGTH